MAQPAGNCLQPIAITKSSPIDWAGRIDICKKVQPLPHAAGMSRLVCEDTVHLFGKKLVHVDIPLAQVGQPGGVLRIGLGTASSQSGDKSEGVMDF